jgi:PIN domain nuclease of toxin-antitoxin system
MRSAEIPVSPITALEIKRKASIGQLPFVWTPYPSLTLLLRAQGFAIQPFGWEKAEQANLLPPCTTTRWTGC